MKCKFCEFETSNDIEMVYHLMEHKEVQQDYIQTDEFENDLINVGDTFFLDNIAGFYWENSGRGYFKCYICDQFRAYTYDEIIDHLLTHREEVFEIMKERLTKLRFFFNWLVYRKIGAYTI